ncbi:hypothetical protein FLM52_08855 [bacterium Scap17]|nr:hypothetical protein [bacterium Scap17]
MSESKQPAVTIKKWVWRALFTSTMIPLLLVETALVAVYFVSNEKIRDANLNYLQSQSSSELNLAMLREAKSLSQQLEHVQNLSRGLGVQAGELAMGDASSGVTAREIARHASLPSGVWASQQTADNQGSGFYPALPDSGQDIPLALRMTAVDPIMRSVVSSNSAVIQSFTTMADCYVRLFPYVDLASLVPADHDCRDFSFFYLAAPEANPSRNTIWTDIYEDPAGNGWMASAVSPFYSEQGEFLGVAGVDMTLDVIVNQVLAMELPWQGFAMLFDAEGRSLAVPRAGEQLLSLLPLEIPDANDLQKEDVIRPAQLDLKGHDVFKGLAPRILEQRRGLESVNVAGAPYKVAWERLPGNGWIMLSMVEESAVFFRTAEIGRNFQLVGMALVGGLFYFAFFILMSWRTHHISRRLSVPLAELRERLHRIGMGAEIESAGGSGIVELDDANATAEEMYQRLRQTQKELQSSERRLLDSLEASGDSLWEMDIPERIVRIHPNLWKMLGASGHEPLAMREMDFDRLIHPEDLEQVHAIRHKILTTYGESFECQYRMRAPQEEDLQQIEAMGMNEAGMEVGTSEAGGVQKGGALEGDDKLGAERAIGTRWVLLSSRGRVVSWDTEGNALKAAGMHIRIR